MSINRKKHRRQRKKARQQFKLRGERRLLAKIENALVPDPRQRAAGKMTNFGTSYGRMSSSQPNLQALPRQRIIDQAASYLTQYRKSQGL